MARTWPKLRNRGQSAVDSPRLQLWALESTEIPGEPDPSWADHRHVTAGTAWPELHGLGGRAGRMARGTGGDPVGGSQSKLGGDFSIFSGNRPVKIW